MKARRKKKPQGAPAHAMLWLETGHRVLWDGKSYAWDLDALRQVLPGPNITLVQAPPGWNQKTIEEKREWLRAAIGQEKHYRALKDLGRRLGHGIARARAEQV